MDLFELGWSDILGIIPELLAWGTGIVLAIIMVRRGGTKAEKLLLSGCCLMLAVRFISLFLDGLTPWLLDQRISASEYGLIRSITAVPALAGIVCLIIAFWVKFRRKKQVTA
jgi:hypothetical protein